MLYYVKIDKDKDVLEVMESKNIHNLAKELKMSWGDLNYYLNGDDKEVQWLPCGIIMPLIKRNGDMYLVSYLKGWIEMKNYNGMSKKVYNDINNIGRSVDIKTMWTHKPVINHYENENKVSTDIISISLEKRKGDQ